MTREGIGRRRPLILRLCHRSFRLLPRGRGRVASGAMKSFFASFFGSLVALVVFVFGGMFLMFVALAMIAALVKKAVS